jgi:hypothetical protein
MPADTVTPAFTTPLAVVCHDAGALELMLPWLARPGLLLRAYLRGPALELWGQRMGGRDQAATLQQALDGAAMLLSGSSWTADLEHEARLQAAALGLHSVAVIDHWIGYAARFQRNGVRRLPDEIWVCDSEAFALAQATFPGHDIRLQPNDALREQVAQLAPCPDPRRRPTVLLLPEPIDNAAPGADQQGLDFLVTHARRLGLPEVLSLRLRPHDRDAPGRWNAWIETRRAEGHQVRIDTAPSLLDAIDRVAWVAGFESTALVLAHAAGRRAVCLQPPWLPRSRLPQRGLIHLRDLVLPQASAA